MNNKFNIGSESAGDRLDNFLLKLSNYGAPKSVVHKIIRTGQCRVNGGRTNSRARLAFGDEVRVPPFFLSFINGDKEVAVPASAKSMAEGWLNNALYEDDDLLVINKPSGIAVHAGSNLSWGVIEALRAVDSTIDFELVHRIDRETSGCLLIAKNKDALKKLHSYFTDDETLIQKQYKLLVHGVVKGEHFSVDKPLLKTRDSSGQWKVIVSEEGKDSKTIFNVDDVITAPLPLTMLSANLITGRTHQIRTHISELGHPIVGDRRYGHKEDDKAFSSMFKVNRLFLHAYSIKILGYKGSNDLEIVAPEPKDFVDIFN